MADDRPKKVYVPIPLGEGIVHMGPHDPIRSKKAHDWEQTGPLKDVDAIRPDQFQYYQNREEPDDTNAYNKGGMVKHGSATRVTCKRKG